jgi:ADP-ribose pyrophosphatase YjhB (NUDIX family)
VLAVRDEGGRERPWCAACNRFVFGRFSVGVGGFLMHEGRVLLVQRGKEPGKGRWTFPGGFLEEDEAPDEGLAREVLEETGLSVAAEGLLAVRHAQTDSEQNVYCVYRLKLTGPIADLIEGGDGDEVSRVVLVDPVDLSALGDVGGVTRWIIERVRGDAAPMKLAKNGFPVVPTHRWSVLVAP